MKGLKGRKLSVYYFVKSTIKYYTLFATTNAFTNQCPVHAWNNIASRHKPVHECDYNRGTSYPLPLQQDSTAITANHSPLPSDQLLC